MIIAGPFDQEKDARACVSFPDAKAYISPRDRKIYVVQAYTDLELRDHVMMVTEPFRQEEFE